jgi:Na+/proline symporter
LWFNIAHYALRPWPWIITGLVALAVYSPHGGLHPDPAFAANPQQGYVMVLRDYLPPALRGLMIAAFLAAFMSTLGTQLNWGVSYLVNDFYRRFVAKSKTEKHYVAMSRLLTIGLVLVSAYVASQLTSVSQGWRIVYEFGVGTGAVYILRWYWWRINAWSEIVAMVTAAVVTIFLGSGFVRQHLGLQKEAFTGNEPVVFAKTLLVTLACTTVAWVLATFLTPAESDAKLVAFYRRVHPTVHGWKKIAALAPEIPQVRDLGSNALNWIAGCLMVYCSLFGIGKLVFGEWLLGILLLGAAAVAGWFIFWDLSRRGWQTLSGSQQRKPAFKADTAEA